MKSGLVSTSSNTMLHRPVLILTTSLLLIACNVLANTNITFCKNQSWRTDNEVITSTIVVDMVGGPAVIDEIVRQEVAETTQENPDIKVSWERKIDGGSYVWLLTATGSNWDSLKPFLNPRVLEYQTGSNGKVVHISGTIVRDGQVQGTYNLRLSGEKIVSSNADFVENNTAYWNDVVGREFDVVLVESWCWERYSHLVPFLIGGVIVVLLGFGLSFIAHQKQRQSRHSKGIDEAW